MSIFLCHRKFLVIIYFNAYSTTTAKTKAQKVILGKQPGVKLMFHVCWPRVLSAQLFWYEISGNNFHRHTLMHSSQVRP